MGNWRVNLLEKTLMVDLNHADCCKVGLRLVGRFQDKTVAESETLFYVTLSIWSWSLLQFTLVFTKKTKKKKKKKREPDEKCCGHKSMKVCCSVDVWSILINIILQDAPFFTFRLLLIFYYKVISYMNIFFTCKNTLVIILQFYRLIVVQAEKRKGLRNPQLSKGKFPYSNPLDPSVSLHSWLHQLLIRITLAAK